MQPGTTSSVRVGKTITAGEEINMYMQFLYWIYQRLKVITHKQFFEQYILREETSDMYDSYKGTCSIYAV